MRKMISAVLALFCCVLMTGSVLGVLKDKPDAGGLDIEEGLRLRIYWIGEDFDTSLPLDPSQSPNVDLTVQGITVNTGDVFQDDQAITDKKDEKITNQYIAEWSGWIQMRWAGDYYFKIDSESSTQLMIDDKKVEDKPVKLDVGWHTIRLTQRVKTPQQQAITLKWAEPFQNPARPNEIRSQQLRAPAFYFRPTQSGKKSLVDGSARPGLGKKLVGVHPGYRVTCIRPLNPDGSRMEMPVGGIGMLSDGRLVVARFEATTLKAPSPTEAPNGELWLISNPTSDDPAKITGEKIADGMFEPCGLIVLDDVIYVSQRMELSKFVYNAQTKQWDKAVVATGWGDNDFHQISAGLPWVAGPTPDHPGFLYMTRGTGLAKGQNPPNHGSVWKIDLSKPVGENIDVLTGGHRTPNGIGLNADGEAFVIDNQGGWTPANEINHVQKGHFYGFYQNNKPPNAYASPFQPEVKDGTTGVTEAAIKLPQDEIGNSPTQLLMFPRGHFFEGQLAVGDMRYGGINRVFIEKVNGVYQGCAMRFTQGLEAGPNRIFFGPDGSLYVGGIGGKHAATWYWVNAQGQPTYQGLERLTPTGEKVFEIDHMTATPDGFVLSFTQPILKQTLENPAAYKTKQWTYKATNQYGGPKIDEEQMTITQAVAAADGKSVRLTIPGLKAGYVVHIQTDPVSTDGKAIWSGDVWYTLNQIPAR